MAATGSAIRHHKLRTHLRHAFAPLLACALGCTGENAADSAALASHFVVVSQAGSTTLAVIDPSAGRIVQRIQVGELPHRLLRNRAGDTLYAVLVGSQAVAEIDTRTLQLRRTLLTAPVPDTRTDGTVIEPHQTEHAFDHTTCFDCHHAAGAKPVIVGERPVGIALSEDETRLYVSHIRGARLSVIDLATGALLRSVLLPPTAAAVEAADLVRLADNLVVALRPTQPSIEPGAVRFLDESSLELRAEFATGSDPASLMAVPARDSVLVSNFESDTVTELGPTREPRQLSVTPGPLGSLLLPDAARALTLDYYSNAASLVNLATGEVTQFTLQDAVQTYVNPTHAALDPEGELAYVVSSGTDGHLLVLDLNTRALRTAIPIDGLSFDAVAIPR
jgi:DNA-binding beta-propeller fold protein YncE